MLSWWGWEYCFLPLWSRLVSVVTCCFILYILNTDSSSPSIHELYTPGQLKSAQERNLSPVDNSVVDSKSTSSGKNTFDLRRWPVYISYNNTGITRFNVDKLKFKQLANKVLLTSVRPDLNVTTVNDRQTSTSEWPGNVWTMYVMEMLTALSWWSEVLFDFRGCVLRYLWLADS